MFLGLPITGHEELQKIALILNTALLIGALLVIELIYSEVPKKKRRELIYFFPIVVVLTGLLLFAVYKQGAGS